MKTNLKKAAFAVMAAMLCSGAYANYYYNGTVYATKAEAKAAKAADKAAEKAAKAAIKAQAKAAKTALPKAESEAVNSKLLKNIANQSGITYKTLGSQAATTDANGVKTVAAKNLATGAHLGKFNFNSIQSGGASVQYGEWTGNQIVNGSNRSVYYAGDARTKDMPTAGTATYSVKGINNYAGNNLMTGTLKADFGARTLAGSLANSSVNMNINSYIDTKDAEFKGVATANNHVGKVEGNFFGAGASSLAGVAKFKTNSNLNTAFGGVKQ